MRLLYCYAQFLNEDGKPAPYRGMDQIELNFSTVDRFSYDVSTNTLRRSKRTSPLPEGFWNVEPVKEKEGASARTTTSSTRKDAEPVVDTEAADLSETTNIYNINVISGENGSGKTTAMQYLIDLLDGLHVAIDPAVGNRDRMVELGVAGNKALLLFEEGGIQYLLQYTPVISERQEPPHEEPATDGGEREQTARDERVRLAEFAIEPPFWVRSKSCMPCIEPTRRPKKGFQLRS